MSTIQPYKIEQKVKDGQKARWPYMSDYSEPQREGYAFIGWKFNNNVFRPPFNDETTNPFGPIKQDTEIYSVWDKVVGLNVTSSQTTITSGSNLIEIEYWGNTLNGLIFANNINVEFIDVTQEGKQSIQYQDNGDTFVSNKIKKSIQILPNSTTEQRYLKLRVIFDNLKSSIVEIIQDAKQESEECQPITENTTGTTTLSMRLFGVDTNKNVFLGYSASTYDIYYNCGSTFIGLLEKNNTGGLVMQNSRMGNIDDFAVMTKLPTYYGNFNQVEYTSTYTIKTVKNSTTNNTITINYKGIVDEDNLMLLRGSITSKAIRVPCSGLNGTISISQYPYDYISDFFNSGMKIIFMTVLDGNFTSYDIEGNTFSYEDSITGLPTFEGDMEIWSNSAIDYDFTYNISSNDTCGYRFFVVYCSNHKSAAEGAITPQYGTKQTDDSCIMLQFIQEFDVKNRIYYGYYVPDTNKMYPFDFDDRYYETSSDNYKFHSFFETCGSKTLTENTFSVNSNNYSYAIAYPNNDFDYGVSYDNTATETTLTDNYTWGDKTYTIKLIENAPNITFTKNTNV